MRSTETYIGAERGERCVDAEPNRLRLNEWTLVGDWSVGKEAAVLNQADGRVAYRFYARDVNLVMGPAKLGNARAFGCSLTESLRAPIAAAMSTRTATALFRVKTHINSSSFSTPASKR
ncbi:MAG: hypothetical protein WBV40_03215 [Candidatus Cybelea sp.]